MIRGLTLAQVGEAASIADGAVSNIERAKVQPTLDRVFRLADALNLDASLLFVDSRRFEGEALKYFAASFPKLEEDSEAQEPVFWAWCLVKLDESLTDQARLFIGGERWR